MRLTGIATIWQMTSKELAAADQLGQSPQVEVKETAIGEVSSTLSKPPICVNIYRFPAVRTAEWRSRPGEI